MEGERERKKTKLRNERASTTDQTGKRHRFPFPAMPACIRLAVVGGVFASLPLPGACAGLAWFDAGHDADAVIVTYTLTSSTWHSGASFICLDAFVCRQVSTHPDAVGDRAGQGRTLVQPSRAGCKPRYICTVHGLYGTDWSFPGQGRFGPVCLCPGVGCSCSSLAVTTRHPVVCVHVH